MIFVQNTKSLVKRKNYKIAQNFTVKIMHFDVLKIFSENAQVNCKMSYLKD